MKNILISLLICLLISTFVFSQDLKSNYFSFNDQNMLMVRVNIWGYVNNPQTVLVPDGTDLITAISYASGPNENANVNDIEILHFDGTKTRCDIAKYKNETDRRHNPVLRPGDTVIVHGSFFYNVTRLFKEVYQVAVIAQVITLVYIYLYQ